MPDGGAVVLAEEMRAEFVDVELAELAEKIANIGIRAMESLRNDVDLRPIAGRQYDCLADVVSLRKPVDPA